MANPNLILVVEDEELLLDIILKKLNNSNIKAEGFKSAEDALAHLEKTDSLPDVIWLDYYLKGMNGFEFTKALKANQRLAHIPVIVVTNSSEDSAYKSMMDVGAAKYLQKASFRLDDILFSINNFLETQPRPKK